MSIKYLKHEVKERGFMKSLFLASFVGFCVITFTPNFVKAMDDLEGADIESMKRALNAIELQEKQDQEGFEHTLNVINELREVAIKKTEENLKSIEEAEQETLKGIEKEKQEMHKLMEDSKTQRDEDYSQLRKRFEDNSLILKNTRRGVQELSDELEGERGKWNEIEDRWRKFQNEESDI